MSHKAKLLYECKKIKYPLIETLLILPTPILSLPYKESNLWNLSRECYLQAERDADSIPHHPVGTMLIYAPATSSDLQTGTNPLH